ncbi:unnamed protein product, partial [Sphenostylis stenocarpa]
HDGALLECKFFHKPRYRDHNTGANVGGSTPSPPPIVGSTPPVYQSTPSPVIASNASTPIEPVATSPSTHIPGTHSTSAVNHNHVQDEENVLHSEEEVPSVGDHAARGRYKGRVYGVGHVDSSDDCVESYLQQTEVCSSQKADSHNISQLTQRLESSEQRLESSEEKIRMMSSQFESIQAFIGVVLQYLPPPAVAAAQNILQQLINQDNGDQEKVAEPNTEQQNQDQQKDADDDYMDY